MGNKKKIQNKRSLKNQRIAPTFMPPPLPLPSYVLSVMVGSKNKSFVRIDEIKSQYY